MRPRRNLFLRHSRRELSHSGLRGWGGGERRPQVILPLAADTGHVMPLSEPIPKGRLLGKLRRKGPGKQGSFVRVREGSSKQGHLLATPHLPLSLATFREARPLRML